MTKKEFYELLVKDKKTITEKKISKNKFVKSCKIRFENLRKGDIVGKKGIEFYEYRAIV